MGWQKYWGQFCVWQYTINMVFILKSVLTLTFSSRKFLECLVNVFNQNGKFSPDSSQEYCWHAFLLLCYVPYSQCSYSWRFFRCTLDERKLWHNKCSNLVVQCVWRFHLLQRHGKHVENHVNKYFNHWHNSTYPTQAR